MSNFVRKSRIACMDRMGNGGILRIKSCPSAGSIQSLVEFWEWYHVLHSITETTPEFERFPFKIVSWFHHGGAFGNARIV